MAHRTQLKILINGNGNGATGRAKTLASISYAATQHSWGRDHLLCIAPRSSFGFWLVTTRSTSLDGFGSFLQRCGFESARSLGRRAPPDPPDLVVRWVDLRDERRLVLGRPVALMLASDVGHVLTLNTADFTQRREITVLEPQNI